MENMIQYAHVDDFPVETAHYQSKFKSERIVSRLLGREGFMKGPPDLEPQALRLFRHDGLMNVHSSLSASSNAITNIVTW